MEIDDTNHNQVQNQGETQDTFFYIFNPQNKTLTLLEYLYHNEIQFVYLKKDTLKYIVKGTLIVSSISDKTIKSGELVNIEGYYQEKRENTIFVKNEKKIIFDKNVFREGNDGNSMFLRYIVLPRVSGKAYELRVDLLEIDFIGENEFLGVTMNKNCSKMYLWFKLENEDTHPSCYIYRRIELKLA